MPLKYQQYYIWSLAFADCFVPLIYQSENLWKINVKINSSMKTPFHGHKELLVPG